jgi:hypothetical protein
VIDANAFKTKKWVYLTGRKKPISLVITFIHLGVSFGCLLVLTGGFLTA